jgi:TolC family type I secretion outer membrane protein
MLRDIKLIAVFLLFLSAALTDAKAEEVLTWEDCLKEAKENHPDLISAQEQLNQARADKAIARSEFLPQISSNLSEKTSQTATATATTRTETYSYDVTGTQLLFDGFKTSYSISSATEDIKSAQYDYQATSSNVRLSLRTAFVGLLKAQQLLHITEDIAARRKNNLELVKLRYEAGREHKGSLLNAQANLAQADFEVTQAGRDIDLAQRQLAKELGREESTSIRAEGELKIEFSGGENPDFERLAESNPLLQELIAKKEAARFDLKSAKAEFFPEIYANASAGRTDSHWPPDNETWSAGVSLSLPIFEGGSRIAGVSKAEATLNQARADERSGKDSVIFTLEETWKEWQDAIDKVGVEEKFLEAAEERAKITRAQYSIGLVSFDDWSIIEDNLVSAKKSFLNARADALVKEANWIQAKGGTLDYVQE